VIPIIDIPGVGTTAAISVVEKLKIKSQNDRELLEQAKKEVYSEGYYKGVLIVGPHKGMYPLIMSSLSHFHVHSIRHLFDIENFVSSCIFRSLTFKKES
jgi:leucyl-tRNA synthetase